MSVAESFCVYINAELTTLQAFIVIAVYNMARMKVAVIPIVVRVWNESMVALTRAKVLLSSLNLIIRCFNYYCSTLYTTG